MGRTILQIAYHLIRRQESYDDLGADYLEQRNAEARIRYLTWELEKLTCTVTIEPQPQVA